MDGCGFVDHPLKNRSKSTVDIYYQNVRGLCTKLENFYVAVSSSNSNLSVITETGLNGNLFATQNTYYPFTQYCGVTKRMGESKVARV